MTADHGSTHSSPSPSLRANRPAVNAWSGDYLDAQYELFRKDPSSVPADLAQFFQGFELALDRGEATRPTPTMLNQAAGGSALQRRIDDLVSHYRAMGHLGAKLDPLGRERTRPAQLAPAFHGINAGDMTQQVAFSLAGSPTRQVTVTDAVAQMERIYCGSIGVECTHIADERERAFFLSAFEAPTNASTITRELSPQQRALVLEQLTAAERFDKFLGVRYQGKKRFSLEGAESLIPLLKWLTQRAGELGVGEIVMGMPHRGRLSVLRNYLGKDLQRLFTEFEDSWSEGSNQGGGDVKYHRGYSGDQAIVGDAAGKSVHLSMLNNPSHLESVNPVVMGRCRARQDATGDTERRKVVSVLLHGDAAMMGQGVVAECLNMSQLEGYSVGGTIHIVVNNQVGFTTDPNDSRSTTYCTDIAKMIGAPVLHVNGDDPEAVVACAMLAIEYRQEFRKDVFIDLVCFRRYGHNEQDEPNYTQPGLYALVRAHPGTAEVYRRKLIAAGVVTESQATAMAEAVTNELDAAQSLAKSTPVNPVPPPGGGQWAGMVGAYSFDAPKTQVDAKTIAEVCGAMGRAPEGFNVHPKLRGLLQARAALPTTKKLSHADAEQIAVGTLLLDGYRVRLSGQDSRRGTFTQRHAVLRDEKTDQRYTPLNHIREAQPARFDVWDSPLSEYAVMGFDYGYSRAWPKTLVMWEGQFGDFVNGAQIMIDQFLASSEIKWSRWAGLTLLLPHGYEGQGPEHSSARLERFLQLCADDNMEVVYPSTGAQMFHLLRRQALRNFRKPLIVMTPKKFLRVETSTIDELSTGSFQHFIDDNTITSSAAKNVSTVLYCSGKVYHELHERRVATQRADVAIIRVEQLYPFHTKLAREVDARYPKGAARVWVQEEPRNQGAFLHMLDVFNHQVGVELGYIGRAPSASPATGSEHAHKGQQEDILTRAIGPLAKAAPDAHAGNGATAPVATTGVPAAKY